MFRSSTIIRELAMNLAKAIFMVKHSVKLRRYLLCGCVAACHGMACVLCFVRNETEKPTVPQLTKKSAVILRRTGVHNRVHKSPPLVPILSYVNSIE